MSVPRRHHYLSEFYLRGFTDTRGNLHVWDTETSSLSVRRPRDTAVERDFNRIDGASSLDEAMTLERLLGEEIEPPAKPAIETLRAGDPLSGEHRKSLAAFLAVSFLRTPAFRTAINRFEADASRSLLQIALGTPERARRLLEESGAADEVTAEGVREFVMRGEYEIGVSRNVSLKAMVDAFPAVATVLEAATWKAVHAPGFQSFITSDRPLIVWPPRGLTFAGLATAGCVKVMPLASDLALEIVDGPRGIEHLTPQSQNWVRQVNLQQTRQATRFVVGPSARQLESLLSPR